MHNAALKTLGLNWRYLAFEVHPNRLREVIRGAAAMKFVGLNLTLPHKLLALELVDELDSEARTWGAVNTIRFEARDARGDWKPLNELAGDTPDDLRAVGFNTDADALSRSLKEELGVELRGVRVLVLGTGGAGRSAALKLAGDGAHTLFLVNRTSAKAEEVADEIRRNHPRCAAVVGYPNEPVDLVINATSLGLKADDPLPFDPARYPIGQARAAFDMIYRPFETRFLKTAKAAGCRVANGISMLLYQGARALELWTGRPAPLDVMRHALRLNVYGS
jgi:shikimate dehydrogenase